MSKLVVEIRRQIDAWEEELGHPFWTNEDVLVVGVSGGPDSLALLHLLARAGLHEPQSIVVAHLDHLLRSSSTDEAGALARLCQRWALRFTIEAVDVGHLARTSDMTVEEAARTSRYHFLGKIAQEVGSHHVVVGHTANDQAETVLMHMIRGTGLAGLRGMKPASAMPDFADIFLLRPLLAVTRLQVEAYCKAHDLYPVYDASNTDVSFFRNRLRHHLLPLLEEYNPQILERLLNTAEVVRADVEFLESETDAALHALVRHSEKDMLRLDLERWRQLPLSLRRRTLRQAVWRLRHSLRDVGFAPIEQARAVAERGQVGSKSNLPGGLLLELEYDALLLSDPRIGRGRSAPQCATEKSVPLAVPGAVPLKHGWQLQAEAVANVDPSSTNYDPDSWIEHIDADRAGTIGVRTRRAGERMQPLGMKGKSNKVADIMINNKLPAQLRRDWPIVANDHHVVWLVGIGLDERVRINKNTRSVIQLRCVRAES